jgi:hypothetical protein
MTQPRLIRRIYSGPAFQRIGPTSPRLLDAELPPEPDPTRSRLADPTPRDVVLAFVIVVAIWGFVLWLVW